MVVLTGFGSAGGATKKVNALSADYPKTNTPMTNIYYFSDSAPAFGEIFDSYIGLNVTYDIQYLLTPQELTYMLYSGYFWGFNQNSFHTIFDQSFEDLYDGYLGKVNNGLLDSLQKILQEIKE